MGGGVECVGGGGDWRGRQAWQAMGRGLDFNPSETGGLEGFSFQAGDDSIYIVRGGCGECVPEGTQAGGMSQAALSTGGEAPASRMGGRRHRERSDRGLSSCMHVCGGADAGDRPLGRGKRSHFKVNRQGGGGWAQICLPHPGTLALPGQRTVCFWKSGSGHVLALWWPGGSCMGSQV